MARGDRTGPNGAGPMTGRAAGFCAGYATPGFANPSGGRGMGWGMGFGRRRGFGGRGGGFGRNWFGNYGGGWNAAVGAGTPYLTSESEKQFLIDQSKMLQAEMASIQKRIEALEAADDKS